MNKRRALRMLGVAGALIWSVGTGLATVALMGVSGLFDLCFEPAYFPGDPAAADLAIDFTIALVAFAAVATALSALASWLTKSRILAIHARVELVAIALAIVICVPALRENAKRNFGEWAEVKALIIKNEAKALELSGATGGQLSKEQYEKIRDWFKANPVTFRFRELKEPVTIRPMSSLPPYVGVDFGDGRNAMFETRTMHCTYSD